MVFEGLVGIFASGSSTFAANVSAIEASEAAGFAAVSISS
jgi:hypothetical protein